MENEDPEASNDKDLSVGVAAYLSLIIYGEVSVMSVDDVQGVGLDT